jgi:uncharacterized protein
VKLLDANILLYAYDSDSAHHSICRSWLETALNSGEIVALRWQTLLAFVRISTNSKLPAGDLTGKQRKYGSADQSGREKPGLRCSDGKSA